VATDKNENGQEDFLTQERTVANKNTGSKGSGYHEKNHKERKNSKEFSGDNESRDK